MKTNTHFKSLLFIRNSIHHSMLQGFAALAVIKFALGLNLLGLGAVIQSWPAWAYSAESQELSAAKSRGIEFHSPIDFFGMATTGIPETESLNANHNLEIASLRNYLASQGIAITLGTNPNRSNYFDLYMPYAGILVEEPAAQIGTTSESEIGKLHYITHDSIHLFSGIPGPRRTDLKDREASVARMTRILLDIEGLATSWTGLKHAKWYWNWRNRNQGKYSPKTFEKFNRGLFSIGPITESHFVDLVRSLTRGEPFKYGKIVGQNIDVEYLRTAFEAGVPMLFPRMDKYLTAFGERLVLQYGAPVVLGFLSYFKGKTGYLNFRGFAKAAAEFYYQPWYVDWAERFQIGEPMDDLEKSIEKKYVDMKSGQFLSDVEAPPAGVYEVAFLRNQVAQFGRKLIELRELNRQQSMKLFDSVELSYSEAYLIEAQDLHRDLQLLVSTRSKSKEPVAEETILKLRERVLSLFAKAQGSINVEEMIPLHLRLPFSDYREFWQDPFVAILPRPKEMRAFMSALGIRQIARKFEFDRTRVKLESLGNKKEKPMVLNDFEIQLASDYIDHRKGELLVKHSKPEQVFYLHKLATFREAMKQQVDRVVIPQIVEFESVSSKDKEQLISSVHKTSRALDEKLQVLAQLYTEIFNNKNRTYELQKTLVATEASTLFAASNFVIAMRSMLTGVARGFRKTSAIKKFVSRSERLVSQMQNGERIKLYFSSNMGRLFVLRNQTLYSACTALLKLCVLGEDISKLARNLPIHRFLRGGQKEIIYKGWSLSETALPENAVVILALNHDYGILDGKVVFDLNEKLGVPRTLLTASRLAYPHLKFHRSTDPDTFFVEDPMFMRQVLKTVENHGQGKIAVAVFPEGTLPLWTVQFPLVAKMGAFRLARQMAVRLAGRRPVYLLNGFTNSLEHITSEKDIPFEVTVSEPIEVPAQGPVTKYDSWIEEQRQNFETNANVYKGHRMTDLIDRKLAPDTLVPQAAEPREYISFPRYFESRATAPDLKKSVSSPSHSGVRCSMAI